jgi:diguanylate cyclase (GGDEF)-like protein
MFIVDEDGYVYASTNALIPAFSYLAAQNPQLVEIIDGINKDKGVIEIGKHVYLYETTAISMGKKTYLIKDIPNQQLIPTYYYVIIGLMLIMVFVVYYLKKLWQEKHSLTRLSYIDELSGLHNRHYLKKIEANLDDNASYFVAIFDIDHFKKVNDKYGHAIGDQVIKRVANVIKLSIRADDYAFRIGGEEFCVIVKTHSPIEALGIFERIRSEIQAISQHPKVTISGGATSYEKGLAESTSFADKLLYTAKQSGRNKIIADWTRNE